MRAGTSGVRVVCESVTFGTLDAWIVYENLRLRTPRPGEHSRRAGVWATPTPRGSCISLLRLTHNLTCLRALRHFEQGWWNWGTLAVEGDGSINNPWVSDLGRWRGLVSLPHLAKLAVAKQVCSRARVGLQ